MGGQVFCDSPKLCLAFDLLAKNYDFTEYLLYNYMTCIMEISGKILTVLDH